MDGLIRVPADGTGKKLDTSQVTIAGDARQRQRINIGDPEDPAAMVKVTNNALDVNAVAGGLLPLTASIKAPFQGPTPRAVVDGDIQLPPDSTGKRLDTSQLNVGGNPVQRQRFVLADPNNPAGLVNVVAGALNVNIASLGGVGLNIGVPTNGDVLTYDTSSGSGRWVAKTPTGGDTSGLLSRSGGTMTGVLVLAADPAANLQAATKQYVDNGFLPLTGKAADSALLNGKADTAFATPTNVSDGVTTAKAYTDTELTAYLTEQETLDAIAQYIEGTLKDKGKVATRTALPATADDFDMYHVEDEDIDVYARNISGTLTWRDLSFSVDLTDYVKEAPKDGKLYSRLDGEWEEITKPVVEVMQRRAMGAGTPPTDWTAGNALFNFQQNSTNPVTIDLSKADGPADESVYQHSGCMTNWATVVAATISGLVPDMTYKLRFHWCEPSTPIYGDAVVTAINQRVMRVTVGGGTPISQTIDLFALVGIDAAYVWETEVRARTSSILINIERLGGMRRPFLNGLEVFKATHLISQADLNERAQQTHNFVMDQFNALFMVVPLRQQVTDEIAQALSVPDPAKIYGRKTTGWAEIPAGATGNYLPLTGGTITGSLSVAGQFDVDSDGGITLRSAGTVMLVSADEDVRVDGKFTVYGPVNLNGTVILASDPTQDYQAATKKYVDDRPAGSALPLTGGTVTGNTSFTANLTAQDLRSLGSCDFKGSFIQAEASMIDLQSTSTDGLHLHTIPGTPIDLDGNTNIGSNSAGKSLRVYGDIIGNTIETTGRVKLDGTDIHVGSMSAGSVWIESGQNIVINTNGQTVHLPGNTRIGTPNTTSLVINGGLVDIACQGSNLNLAATGGAVEITGPLNVRASAYQITLDGPVMQSGSHFTMNSELHANGQIMLNNTVYLNGTMFLASGHSIRSMGPDTYNTLDIRGGANPQIDVGSSNFQATVNVFGQLNASRLYGQLVGWETIAGSPRESVSLGSGIFFSTDQGFTFERRTGAPQYWPRFSFTGSGVQVRDSYGMRIYNPGESAPQHKLYPGSVTLGGSFCQVDGYFQAQGGQFNAGLGVSGDLWLGGQAYKPGGGPFQTASDARLKTDVEAYTDGLDKLMQLKPIKFRYNARARMSETGKQYVGLAAEDAKKVMPSLVGSMKAKIDYEDKEPTDVLTLDSSELIYTVINALKQIDNRLKALEQHAEKVTEQATKKAEALSSSPKTAKHK